MHLEDEVNAVVLKLHEAGSREYAENILSSINHPRRKDFLLRLARACDVQVTSKDNISTIQNRVIESVVGAKLSSEAIQKVAF